MTEVYVRPTFWAGSSQPAGIMTNDKMSGAKHRLAFVSAALAITLVAGAGVVSPQAKNSLRAWLALRAKPTYPWRGTMQTQISSGARSCERQRTTP